MVARLLRLTSYGLLCLIVLAVVVSIRPDVSHDALQRDYGGVPTTYLPLASGARAHYVDAGNPDGAAIILLHSEGSSLQEWDPWVQQLGDDYRLVLVDLPGHGLTGRVPGDNYSRSAMAGFALDLANGLGLARFALAGADLGGAVAWELARTHPGRVTDLVLIAPDGIGEVPSDPPLDVILARNPLTRPILRWVSPRWVVANRLHKMFVDDNFVTPAMIDCTWRLERLAGNRVATVRRLALPDAPPLREYDGAIHVPTVVLWGEDDQIAPLDRDRVEWDLRTKFAGDPNAHVLYTFADTGHRPHEEQALFSAALAANFIAMHPAPETAPENAE